MSQKTKEPAPKAEVPPQIVFETWARQSEPDGYWVVRMRVLSDGAVQTLRAPKHKDDRLPEPVRSYYLDEDKSHAKAAKWQTLTAAGWVDHSAPG